ncbi:parasitic phase-specific protein PSP-1 [Histoplasma capsulatum G186AR]|uniref:Parasitic phase-specific protein PSP-1 n=2 Tax=Ajellomyces capsulatus TaxID=5037 RepID=C0NDK2_AJECG|nr:parasitic phase-specific protein PSP-1 [Histoplasma capsulatum G186AR]EEH10300.1 parasitic phase-specific protein PSP-1 [Histoplasma capsulatum G186AR]KAG5290741.1 parasitic phase-specific protein PSP-1 [Histoplasma capsulatum]QSS72669.1 parasitic phase-specific protein PSP-1 [Histoplasma capsulatum G186AR]
MLASLLSALARREIDGDSCTFEICNIDDSYYGYRPSRAANIAFAAIFGFSLVAFVLQSFISRRFLGFSIAMILGTLCELIGYIGRILMYNNPWAQNPFMIQICCLTIAPAFLAAGIYFCLSRIVTTFGRENSRIPAAWYPRIFIPCDILALALQGAGGGIASSADYGTSLAETGTNLMIAGVVWQVAILAVFILLAVDFAIRTLRRMRSIGVEALDPNHAALRSSFAFRSFLVALCLATLFIFIRCVYRIAELSDGWDGPLLKDEPLFIGLESVMIVLAVLVLNAFHPGWGFGRSANAPEVELKGLVP